HFSGRNVATGVPACAGGVIFRRIHAPACGDTRLAVSRSLSVSFARLMLPLDPALNGAGPFPSFLPSRPAGGRYRPPPPSAAARDLQARHHLPADVQLDELDGLLRLESVVGDDDRAGGLVALDLEVAQRGLRLALLGRQAQATFLLNFLLDGADVDDERHRLLDQLAQAQSGLFGHFHDVEV